MEGREELPTKRLIAMPLEHALSKHTKVELLEICRAQNIRKVSGLNKDDLIEKMVEVLPRLLAEKMLSWDQPTYNLMEYMAKEEDPIYPFDPEDCDDVEQYFLNEAIGFAFQDQRGGYLLTNLIIPKEFQEIFLSIDGEDYKNLIQANTKVVRLAKGLLHYYGCLRLGELAYFLNGLLDEPLDLGELLDILLEVGFYTWNIRYESELFVDGRMLKLLHTLDERERRPHIEYRKLTYEEVWLAGEPGFREPTAEFKALAEFVQKRDIEGEELLDAVFGLFQSDLLPTEIIPGVADFLKLESEEMFELASLIIACYNATPQWILKGHTPAQLGSQPIHQVDGFAPKTKVGRNAPCPCGSGRKFKRCCGNN